MSRSILFLIWALALVAAACGEGGLLDGAGERSQDAIYGETTTTVTVVVAVEDERELTVLSSADLSWWNDSIDPQGRGEPTYVMKQVWRRGDRANTHIQASRLEIAAALPDIEFPALVPGEVTWVTSQLVFDLASGTLDRETSAAFGLWEVEPYSVSSGSAAVLRVGIATDSQKEIYADPIPEFVEDGMTISWVDASYRYQLFCRTSVAEELCWRMQETTRSLQTQIPETLVELVEHS